MADKTEYIQVPRSFLNALARTAAARPASTTSTKPSTQTKTEPLTAKAIETAGQIVLCLQATPQPAKTRMGKEEADQVVDHAVRELMEKHQCDYVTAFNFLSRDNFGAQLLKGWAAVAKRS